MEDILPGNLIFFAALEKSRFGLNRRTMAEKKSPFPEVSLLGWQVVLAIAEGQAMPVLWFYS